MFQECYQLTSLNLKSFNIEKTEIIDEMFYQCLSLTSVDLSNFNTVNLTSLDRLFFGCEKLKYIDLSLFNDEKFEYYTDLFNNTIQTSEVTIKYNFNKMSLIKSQIPSEWNQINTLLNINK